METGPEGLEITGNDCGVTEVNPGRSGPRPQLALRGNTNPYLLHMCSIFEP